MTKSMRVGLVLNAKDDFTQTKIIASVKKIKRRGGKWCVGPYRTSLPLKGKIMKKTNQYVIEGQKVPGVTTIIDWKMSKGLCIGFYGKYGLEKCREISNEAKEFGTMVHQIINAYIGGQKQKLSKEKKTIIDNFKKVTKGWNWLETEKVVLNPQLMYGGTVDAIAIVDGKKTLIDLKSGNLYDGKESVQLSAYKECLPEIEQCKIVNLNKDSLTWEVLDRNVNNIFRVFLAYKTIYDYENERLK